MTDSSVRSLGEVEYDNQNSQKCQKKTPVRPKIRSEGHFLLPLYINRSTTKKFPTKRIMKTIDYSVRNTWKVKYDT